jgi:hypothetical protein
MTRGMIQYELVGPNLHVCGPEEKRGGERCEEALRELGHGTVCILGVYTYGWYLDLVPVFTMGSHHHEPKIYPPQHLVLHLVFSL